MLAGGLDPMYRSGLTSSHRPYFLVEVLDGQQQIIESDLVYLAGSVSATLTSRVARTCRLTFTEDRYPYVETDLLAPYGNMIRAWRGIEFADGHRFRWVVFVGRIQEAALGTDGTCTIYAADFAADVVENRFRNPQNSQAGTMVTSEVRRLISDGFPQATFDTFDIEDILVRPLTWQLDRGQALDELATSVSAFWYPLASGVFTLRQYPWTVASPPVVTYADGDGGSVITSSASRSREDVYNVLTVTGERLNGDEPVYATAVNANPASITYVGGNFGIRSQLLRLQTPAIQGSAQAAANSYLRRMTALFDAWDWDMVPDAALELGDVVSLNVRGKSDIIQVVASYQIPLDMSGMMRVRGRSLVPDPIRGAL
jgi:hypothetical protein